MPTRVSRPSPAPLAAELLQAWAEIPTTVASDVSRGRLLVDPRIRPLRPFAGARRLVGPAVTAWCEPGDIGAAALDDARHVTAAEAGGAHLVGLVDRAEDRTGPDLGRLGPGFEDGNRSGARALGMGRSWPRPSWPKGAIAPIAVSTVRAGRNRA